MDSGKMKEKVQYTEKKINNSLCQELFQALILIKNS